MKIVTIIVDGHGLVHVAATRSPDLMRRGHAARTGHADLAGVFLAPEGLGAPNLVARAAARLEELQIGKGTYAALPADVIRTVASEARRYSRRASYLAVWRRLSRPSRRAFHRLAAGRRTVA